MEQLQKVLDYRFWILVGLTPVLAIIGRFVGAGTMASSFDARQNALKTRFTQIDNLAKDKEQPNPQWKNAIDTVLKQAKEDETQAWQALYEQQKDLFVWPTQEVRDAVAALKPGETELPDLIREGYRIDFRGKVLTALVEKLRAQVARTGVTFPADVLEPCQRAWQQTPTTQEIREAQEDIWVVTLLLELIDRINADATDEFSAVIRQVEQLQIREFAKRDAKAAAAGQGQGVGGQGQGQGFNPNPSGGGQVASSDPVGGGLEAPASSGRYVNETESYRLMAFRLVVLMRHTDIPKVLAEFLNHRIPIHITEYRMEGPDFVNQGRAGAPETVVQDLARVEFIGRLFLFKPPPPPGGAVAAGAASQPAGADAAATTTTENPS